MNAIDFTKFLNSIDKTHVSVFDPAISLKKYTHLDLSVFNSALKDIDVSCAADLERYINTHVDLQGAAVAFGGYNEKRNIYQRSTYFNHFDVEMERNIHLGLDLWSPANTAIFAPLDATVHSFKNNHNHGDYGPTIILKHTIKQTSFYTLYGHLSLESLQDLKVGQIFKQGQQLATLGDATVNGDYPPHLHFQIIRDVQSYVGDYPGVSNIKDLEFYLENCPDPNLLLKLA